MRTTKCTHFGLLLVTILALIGSLAMVNCGGGGGGGGGGVPPTASAVSIVGTVQVGQTLTGYYTYADANGDPQGVSTFRWLRNGVAIAGATAMTYTLVAADVANAITFEVTPVSTVPPTTGAVASSSSSDPVVEAPDPGAFACNAGNSTAKTGGASAAATVGSCWKYNKTTGVGTVLRVGYWNNAASMDIEVLCGSTVTTQNILPADNRSVACAYVGEIYLHVTGITGGTVNDLQLGSW